MPLAKEIGQVSDVTRRRFESKVRIDESGCHVWIGSVASNGYGTFWINRRNVAAHRVAWRVAHGEQPAHLQLDHRCRNRLCVNVGHLELTTPRENTLRAVAVNVWEKDACRNGHPFAEVGFYFDRQGTRVCRECKRVTARRQWAKKSADDRVAYNAERRERYAILGSPVIPTIGGGR